MKTEKKAKPELLAPAGDLAAAFAAFENGADAVYAGLRKFNARERNENFTLPEMERLIGHAHERRRQVYVTMNTLVKESELEEAAGMLRELERLRPDALIIQDLGLAWLAREFYPNLTLHASTQMGFHNSDGLAVAADFGFERVIMERQVTVPELAAMVPGAPVEVEVFVHGALCCGLSGKCLFSSWHGGWSGNRGKCKQPCRRRFFSKKGNGFYFSTNDLYTLDLLPELIAAGVASLKIEGRLRKADYVAAAVRAYRMVLDADEENRSAVVKEARGVLSGSLGRQWSHGFYDHDGFDKVVKHDALGVSGLFIGNVAAVRPGAFEIRLAKRLHLGDRIRIQPQSGEEGPALTVTKLLVNDNIVTRAAKGECCLVLFDRPVPSGGLVYRIGVSGGKTPKLDVVPAALPVIDLSVRVDAAGFSVSVPGAGLPDWRLAVDLPPPAKHAVEPGTVAAEFAIAAGAPFRSGRVKVSVKGRLFIAASVLKSARRDFWLWLTERKDELIVAASGTEPRVAVAAARRNPAARRVQRRRLTTVFGAGPRLPRWFDNDIEIIRSCPPRHRTNICREVVLPDFIPQDSLDRFNGQVEAAYADGIRRFRLTSLFQLAVLRRFKDIEVVASYPLPVCNAAAAAILAGYGVGKAQIWLEMGLDEMKALAKSSPLPCEVFRRGRPVLLATRAELAAFGRISDSRGNEFDISRHDGLTVLRSADIFEAPGLPGCDDYFDMIRGARGSGAGSFNLEHGMA